MKSKNKTFSRTTKASAPIDYTVINAVLEAHLDLAWTDAHQALIRRKAGPENHLKIQEIISFTSNQDAWLNDSSVSSAADKVSGKLSQHYPALTTGAVFKIINQATYGWR